eukprot:Phypoly_transcript_20265.p1 GENE.Phypoly_transcript_20265~~Phypoly_transcript_20265.p1  ORF type:complete len:185 (+),score=61.14 Phypoly_transcript_20265:74-628(+)
MKEAHKGSKASSKRSLLASRGSIKKKSPIKAVTSKKKQKMDAQTEILRNTAINSFRVDEKPTKQLILARMQELKAREKKQKEIAACHNLMLQMRKLLPIFNEGEEDGEYNEEEDGDYELEGEEEEVELEYEYEEEDEEDDDAEEAADDDEGEDRNGTVEDLEELGDDESYGKRAVEAEDTEGLE